MPFLQEINPANGIRAGIWQITETAEELLANIDLTDTERALFETFKHELRKKQWLAYHALLKHLLHPLAANLTYNIHGKPCLDSGSHHISVSHAGEFAAAVCSEIFPVGIDIEMMRERVERVKERFLQEKELQSLVSQNYLEQLYVCWGGKEAVYKLHGKPDIDFRNDIYIHPFDYLCNTNQHGKASLQVNHRTIDFTLYHQKTGDYMLVIAF